MARAQLSKRAGLRSGLAVWVFSLPTGSMAGVAREISRAISQLTFSTVQPGGYGTLTARVLLRQAAMLAMPEFGAFAFVCVKAGADVVWLGELMNPTRGYSQREGAYVTLNALGAGNCLRDNAGNWSYTNTAGSAIVNAQLTQHISTKKDLANNLSSDTSQIFGTDDPNRASTVNTNISQVYVARTMEEIIADVAFLCGDMSWGVEADPVQTNALGFPLARVYVRGRDTTSVNAMAYLSLGDIQMMELAPNADRCYNSIEIDYLNGTSGLGTVIVTDSRLASDLSQGTAPFRYRRYARDLSTISTVTATVAQNIAQMYLNLYSDPVLSGNATLQRVRDANGQVMPLYLLAAGMNLALPEEAVNTGQLLNNSRSATFPAADSAAYVQGYNLFWVSQATYREDAAGSQTLDVQLGYLPDDAGIQIARLQMAQDAKQRSGATTATVQAPGAAMTGYYGWSGSNGVAGQSVGAAVTFPAVAANVPTSLSLSSIAASNQGTLAVNNFTAVGANLYGAVSANGACYQQGTYKTVGN